MNIVLKRWLRYYVKHVVKQIKIAMENQHTIDIFKMNKVGDEFKDPKEKNQQIMEILWKN